MEIRQFIREYHSQYVLLFSIILIQSFLLTDTLITTENQTIEYVLIKVNGMKSHNQW